MTKLIYGKMAAIQKGVGAIQKAGVGPSSKGSFSYVKAEDILDKVHSLLVENEVIVVPTLQHTKHEVLTVNNRNYVFATIQAAYEYIAVEDGSSVVVNACGEGSDISSDTATRKAATQALKISHLQTFTIPNNEFDQEGYEPAGAGAPAAKPEPRALKTARKDKVGELQSKVRGFIESGDYASSLVNTIGLRVAKELGKDEFDKNDEATLTALVAQLDAGVVE
jgi:hypothetical protein